MKRLPLLQHPVTRRWVQHVALVCTCSLVFLTIVAPQPAGADNFGDDGVRVSGTVTYSLSADGAGVRVQNELDFTNASGPSNGCWSGVYLPVPLSARVTSSEGRGVERSGKLIEPKATRVRYLTYPEDPSHVKLLVEFANCMSDGDTAHVSLIYELPGATPRSADPTRVSAATIAFEVLGIGGVSTVSMEVVLPSSYDAIPPNDKWEEQKGGDTTKYVLAAPTDTVLGHGIFIANSAGGLTSSPVDLDGAASFDVRAWPNDPEWSTFVTEQIVGGVPQLESLIGVEWPIASGIDVVENLAPAADGYAGRFSSDLGRIELGEALDATVVQHELSHAWFNDSWFAERWLVEGFAQEYASLSVTALGGSPAAPKMVSPGDADRVTLADWDSESTAATPQDAYAYNASYAVIHKITSEIGPDRMRAVLAAVAAGQSAYDVMADPEVASSGAAAVDNAGTVGWQQFLDLAESIGGSKKAADLITAYVAPDDAAPVLLARLNARRAFAVLLDRSGEWAAPAVLLDAMERWEFDEAMALIDDANAVLDLRDQVDAGVTQPGQADLVVPDSIRTEYSTATESLDEVLDHLTSYLEASRTVARAAAAVDRSSGVLRGIGLLGTDQEARLDQARAFLASGDTDRANDLALSVLADEAAAGGDGLVRLGLLGTVAAAIGVTVLMVRARRKPKAAMNSSEPDERPEPETPMAELQGGE